MGYASNRPRAKKGTRKVIYLQDKMNREYEKNLKDVLDKLN